MVGEQIHCVCGMVPQQMIGPTARLTQGVHIGTAKKIGLHVHLKHIEMACLDLLMNKLVTGIKAPRMAAHGHQTVLLLQCHHLGTVFVNITQGNFHLHMFASFKASNGLRGMHLCGSTQNNRIHLFDRQTFIQVAGDMRNAVFVGYFLGFFQLTANEGHHFNAINELDAI